MKEKLVFHKTPEIWFRSCRNGYSKYRSVYRIWFNYRIPFWKQDGLQMQNLQN